MALLPRYSKRKPVFLSRVFTVKMAKSDDVMRAFFAYSDSEQDFESFETATRRDSESLSPISSVHTSDLSDFSSESETKNSDQHRVGTGGLKFDIRV